MSPKGGTSNLKDVSRKGAKAQSFDIQFFAPLREVDERFE